MNTMTNLFDGVRAVLFDMDGTLVETNIDFGLMKREVLSIAERYGVPQSEVVDLDILSVVDRTVSWLQEQLRPAEAEDAERLGRETLERIEAEFCAKALPIPHSLELLHSLQELGIGIGIVTRNCRRAVLMSIERTGVFSDVLLTRDDVPLTKPDPDHLLRALELLHVEPGNAITVGDHWMDVQAGHAAGTRTVGFLRPDRPSDFFDRVQPDLVIRDLGELLPCLERLKN